MAQKATSQEFSAIEASSDRSKQPYEDESPDLAPHSQGDLLASQQRSRFHSSGPLGIQGHHPLDFSRKFSADKASSRRRRSSAIVREPKSGWHWWKFHLRGWDDDEEEDWWFASTGIPLLSATIGPLANVLSIAALVTSWRMCLVPNIGSGLPAQECIWDEAAMTAANYTLGPELEGQPFADPHWCYWINVVSLIFGFVGNLFLLCNFTGRIRYIIALPASIICWFIATGLLTGIMAAMAIYVPPHPPAQTYTEGFWYAAIASCMYFICAVLLMGNMLGFFLGHYPQHFNLTESQKTLILQTMLFFVWLAGGAAVFWRIETQYGNEDSGQNWSYVNALYFCNVTILTVGFGDLYPTSNLGRGLVFPFSVGGIIMLGLMVSSINKFARELGSEKIIKRHIEHSRARTIGRTVTTSLELDRANFRLEPVPPTAMDPESTEAGDEDKATTTTAADVQGRSTTIGFADGSASGNGTMMRRPGTGLTLSRVTSWAVRPPSLRPTRQPKLLLLREEKDRFDAMRRIQRSTTKFKNWYALFLSTAAFGVLWCVGAAVFWQCEMDTQGMTYFQALYFCYVSLLTIGYGDLAPKSNAGRPFFVFWSLIAVPTMTILVSDLGETVINSFNKGTFRLAEFTVLPQKGVWREFLDKHPQVLEWFQQRKLRKEAEKRLEEGFQIGPEPEPPKEIPTLDELAKEDLSESDLGKRLVDFIRSTTKDVRENPTKHYSYEEWVEITQLIRFTARDRTNDGDDEAEEGLIRWDWIGEDSPMMKGNETEFVLDRLCESLSRYIKRMSASVGQDGSKGRNVELNAHNGSEEDGSDDGRIRRRSTASDSTQRDDLVGPRGESVAG